MLHTAPGGVVQHMTEGVRDSPPDDTSYRSWPAPQAVRRLKWLAALCLIHGVDASPPPPPQSPSPPPGAAAVALAAACGMPKGFRFTFKL